MRNIAKAFELIYKQLWECSREAGTGTHRRRKENNLIRIFIRRSSAWKLKSHADGAVIDVLQPGYIFHGRVLRPATVRVAAAPAAESQETWELNFRTNQGEHGEACRNHRSVIIMKC